jgi:hypothetical protein
VEAVTSGRGSVTPVRLTRRAAGDATASLSPYRPAVMRFLAIALPAGGPLSAGAISGLLEAARGEGR